MLNALRRKQFILFILCGGTAAMVNIGSRWIFNFFFEYALSIVLAYCMGMLTAFLLFKFIVFQAKHSNSSLQEVGWFLFVNTIALLQTLCISIGLAEYIFPMIGCTLYPATVAHVVGVVVPAVTSFWGHKYLTFHRSDHAARKLG